MRAVVITVAVVAVVSGCGPRETSDPQADVIPQRAEWEISTGGAFGVIMTVVRCSDVLFLADANLAVRRYDLAAGQLLPEFGASRVGLPVAMFADCRDGALYVANPMPISGGGGQSVQVLDLESGERRAEYPLPPDFLPRPGGWLENGSLGLSGLWARSDQRDARELPAQEYCASMRLGLRLSPTTGVAESLVLPYETTCIGAGHCPDVRLDSVVTPTTVLRVAALPTSAAVGVYEGTELVRVVDVDSPEFVRNGDVLPVRAAADERMRWTGQNSTIDRVFAFRDAVAVVHVLRHIDPSWELGQPIRLNAFMNTYSWDGAPRLQDVPLPGMAVGKGDEVIYAIDYGTQGPRSGVERIRIVQVPVAF